MPDAGITDAQKAEILDSMSAFSDFEALFGRESLQCAFRDTHQHRKKKKTSRPLPTVGVPALPAAEVLWRDLVAARVNYLHHLGSGSYEEQGSKSTCQASSLQQLCGQNTARDVRFFTQNEC